MSILGPLMALQKIGCFYPPERLREHLEEQFRKNGNNRDLNALDYFEFYGRPKMERSILCGQTVCVVLVFRNE